MFGVTLISTVSGLSFADVEWCQFVVVVAGEFVTLLAVVLEAGGGWGSRTRGGGFERGPRGVVAAGSPGSRLFPRRDSVTRHHVALSDGV